MYTTAALNKMIGALGATHVAVFNGDPSAGGTIHDSRQAISFAAPVEGSIDSTVIPEFSISAGGTVNYVGFYDAATAGNLLVRKAVPAESFTEAGIYRLLDADLFVSNPA